MSSRYAVRSFAAGELTPLARGRSDLEAYANGAKALDNAFGLDLGPATRRPGTYYSATAKTAGKKVVLIPWIISATEGRILEVGHDYIRFYDDDGTQIEDAGSPVEVVSPWHESELDDIRYAQIGSYMYLVHPSYAPRKLTRTSDTSWTLTTPTFTAGSGEETFGSPNHYPSLVEVYEDRLIFAATNDKPGTIWGSRVAEYENFSLRRSATVTITIASPGVITWTDHGLTGNATIVFTTTGALPTGLTAGVTYYVVEASITENTFQVSATAGGAAITTTGTQSGTHTCTANPALATDAWEKTPQAKDNNKILWLLAEQALLFGTSSGPFRVGGKETLLTPDLAWWPTRQASVGSSSVQALMIDDSVVFVGRGGERVYRFEYSSDTEKYVPNDITKHAKHLTRNNPILQLAHQREPITILWAVTTDGTLLSGVYSVENSTIAWSPHDLSGTVEAIAVIPTATEDMVWISVARTIDGTVYRHIEYFAPQEWDDEEDCHYVDGGILWDGGAAVTVTSITAADPPVVTASAHGFEDDQVVRFEDVEGLEDANGESLVNGKVFTVKNKDTDTFELYTRDGTAAMDFSGASEAGSGGTAERVTNSLSGLDHLEGEEVEILGDGAQITSETVASGAVTLDEYANTIHAGLGFVSVAEPMDIADAKGQIKRILNAYLQFYRTSGARIGPNAYNMYEVEFEDDPSMDAAPEAQTQDLMEHWPGYYEFEGKMRVESYGPLPWTLLSITAEVET